MANPITWRNVGMPNFGSSNQLQIAAGDQLNAGIAQLGRAAETYRQGQIDAEQQTKDFNTQDFLKRINGFNDLGSYDQFNQTISNELAGLNPAQVDAAQVQSALQNRDNVLRTDTTERNKFNDAPILSQMEALTTKGDTDGAAALMGQLSANSQGQGQALISGELDRVDLQRQSNLINNELTPYLVNNAEDKTSAIESLPQWLKDNNITDPSLIGSIDAGKLFTDATSTTKRQDQITEAELATANDHYNANVQLAESNYRNSLTLKGTEYDDFYGDKQNPWDVVKQVYNQKYKGDSQLPDGDISTFLVKKIFNTDDEDIREDVTRAQNVILGDTVPSGASKTLIDVRDAARELLDGKGRLPKHITEAALANTVRGAMGAQSGDLNHGTLFRSLYEENLLRAIQLDLGKRSDEKLTNEHNARLGVLKANQTKKVEGIRTGSANQNIRALQSAG